MSSETSPPPARPKAPRGGISGFFKNTWRAFLIIMNACFWNTYELLTPHRKFDVQKAVRRPGDNVVITGGARGIGREIVRKLLMLDMNVIMGVRNENAAKTMVDEFRKEKLTTGTVDIFPLDLKSLSSVKEFGTKILEKYSKIHLLINNAGIYDLPYELSEDGYEITFQVNYISHFLLSNMLLPRLTTGGTSEKASRIVNVSSVAHYPGKLDLDDLWMQKLFGSNWAYGNSKLMQATFSQYLNDRFVQEGYPIRSYAVHPGCVSSGLYESWPFLVRFLFWMLFKSNKQGADGVLHVALSPAVENEGGKYFQNCAKFGTNSQVTNGQVQQKLWDASCKATKWEDTLSSNKPKGSPGRKTTPAIVVTKDAEADNNGTTVTKDDLEKEGNANENQAEGATRTISTSSNGSSKSDNNKKGSEEVESAENKIDVKISENSSPSLDKRDGDTVADVPPSVGGSE